MAQWKRSKKNQGFKVRDRRQKALDRLLSAIIDWELWIKKEKERLPLAVAIQIKNQLRRKKEAETLKSRLLLTTP